MIINNIYKFKIEYKKFEYLLRRNTYNKKTIIAMLEHKHIRFMKIYHIIKPNPPT